MRCGILAGFMKYQSWVSHGGNSNIWGCNMDSIVIRVEDIVCIQCTRCKIMYLTVQHSSDSTLQSNDITIVGALKGTSFLKINRSSLTEDGKNTKPVHGSSLCLKQLLFCFSRGCFISAF